ncbi:SUN domain-containing ossification factor isoform X2 [Eurosta solidaginis]|uniref:SUN domain-containing ossification factor isoform X2 n=1 Tax=Eurosta solidaginis TaxID=178769 RepID=UPI003530DA08
MRFNLQVAYLSLLSVTCISSLFLFFVVFTENYKYVAAALPADAQAESDAAAIKKAAVHHTTTTAAADASATPTTLVHDKILSNYKNVKQIINYEDETLQAAPEVDGPADIEQLDEVIGAAEKMSSDVVLPTDDAAVKNDVQKPQDAKSNAKIASASNSDDLQNEDTTFEAQESLPDIREIPTITVTDLPFEILEPTRVNIDALVIDAAKETIAREHENHTMEMSEKSSEVIRNDEEIIKFDDSGGGEQLQSTPQTDHADSTSSDNSQHIPNVNVTIAALPTTTPATLLPTPNDSASHTTATGAPTNADDNNNASKTVNLTVEEVPIPVFSEWAQKQMENEKQQAKEQEVVNTAAQKKNHTNGDGKRQAPLKMRNKNYASPDCGAKIIALNVDATNAGAVLSSSKDEYMLSPCGNRIWFVVELCEAIQAQKVELANFELFSSSPKNFTVAVSNRFPTRDWSNVGRFIAEDTRNVQSFDLHPHLFGKFVRVDIHSHYSKEHFCPLSLFRVFGTSEFEAFETETAENLDLDDFDDEFGQEQQVQTKSADTNLFKSASDAVLSIVKKAAEVLAKPANHLNTTLSRFRSTSSQCRTPTTRQFNCTDCNPSLVARINNLLSCEYQQLQALLKVPWLLKDLQRTRICAKDYGIVLKAKNANENCAPPLQSHRLEMEVKHSYYLNMLPTEYVGALCQLLATHNTTKSSSKHDMNGEKIVTEPSLNLTIDKKLQKDDLGIIGGTQKKLITPETTNIGSGYANTESAQGGTFSGDGALPSTTTESGIIESDQLLRPPTQEDTVTTTMDITTTTTRDTHSNNDGTLDVNIFNVPADITEQQEQKQSQTNEPINGGSHREDLSTSGGEYSIDGSFTTTPTTNSMPSSDTLADGSSMDDTLPVQPTHSTIVTTPSAALGSRSEEDVSSWENIDNLITSTTTAPGGGSDSGSASSDAAMQPNQPGVNLQQKIPSGPQSESVFIRLSNRIKALERNMSLSGQYLEELSRRYKKQVEELQLTLTQTVQTVRTLEEHSRRQSELFQLLAQRNSQLKDELDDLSLQVHACIVVIICVGAFVFLAVMVSILFYRSMRRETKEVLTLYANANKKKTANAVAAMQRKLNRRKSYDDFSDHQQSSEKLRRPSEEALMILKECGGSCAEHESRMEIVGDASAKMETKRERKISVCYSSNMSGQNYFGGAVVKGNKAAAAQNLRQRRKGDKHSWPNTEHAQQQARRHLEQLRAPTNDSVESKQNFEEVKERPPPVPTQLNGGENKLSAANKSRRKSQVPPRRQASVPKDFIENISMAELSATEYDESLRLEEDDLDNFIPTSDLAYNEFMPEGPSGYKVDDSVDGNAESKKSGKKMARLSAPGFFKSPFGKSRNKPHANKTQKHPHESTSWEWYRSKNSAKNKQILSGSASASAGFMRASPIHSLDTSSLSEILLPNSRTENSFRILEEAILSSGESIATTNGTNATNNGYSIHAIHRHERIYITPALSQLKGNHAKQCSRYESRMHC